MNNNKINIVSFNIPLPADYGGVIDVFFKIKALHSAGFEIILHCFQYGREQQSELNRYCTKIYYYNRKKGIRYLFSPIPYIVNTRNSLNLLNNLNKNNYPILFEGLHTCYFIDHLKLQNRQKVIRMHNIEHEYYRALSNATNNVFKKLFYYSESLKLRLFEKKISNANCIVTISNNDFNYFKEKHVHAVNIAAFHPLQNVSCKTGKGKYFIYHGNLNVEENEKACEFLIENVFSHTNAKLIIAGNSPSKHIHRKVQPYKNISLVINPSESEMAELIANAHCCVLPTFQATGLKLKLLISLFTGRHVLVNNQMIENTGLEPLCTIANNEKEFLEKINKLEKLDFIDKNIKRRKEILVEFSNKNLVEKLNTIFNS